MNEEESNLCSKNSHVLYRMADYVILNKLGSGTYGKVFLARNKKDKYLYAIKKLKTDEGIPKQTLREISLLKILQHPNIITLYQVLMTETRCYMVLEYMKMSLYEFITKYEMSPDLIKSFMYQLLQGTLFCHNRGVLHRDIKSHNILVHHNKKVVKLIDFGLARKAMSTTLPLTPVVVTLFYRCPELLLNTRDYSSAVDIWSLGCVFVEMVLKRVPFRGNVELDILFSVFSQLGVPSDEDFPGLLSKVNKMEFPVQENTSNAIKLFKDTVDIKCYNLVMKMFTYNPEKRIDAAEAIRHDFFANFDTSVVPAIGEEDFGYMK